MQVPTLRLFYCLATDEDGADCSALIYAFSFEQALELWRGEYAWYEDIAARRTGPAYEGPHQVRIYSVPSQDASGVVDWSEVDMTCCVYIRQDDGSGWLAQAPRIVDDAAEREVPRVQDGERPSGGSA